jgi:hypothetical protein
MREPVVRRRHLFQNMTRENWINLILAGLYAYFAVQILLDFAWGTVCGHVAVDYCNNIWAAGRVANTHGYGAVYDVALISRVQSSIFPSAADPSLFVPSPSHYLPVIMPIFQLFALLPLPAGYGIWTVITVASMLAYLAFFARSTVGEIPSGKTFALVCVSLPVFFCLFYGTIDVWLMVCIGECIRAWSAGQRGRAGLWLGVLVLQPPLLAVIGLFILLMRQYRIALGAVVSAGALLGVSMTMIGIRGSGDLMALWLKEAAGAPYTGVESMMNWRMLGVNLSHLMPSATAWSIAALGALAIFVLAAQTIHRAGGQGKKTWWIALTGALAACMILNWHSHVHVAVLLLPSLVYLYRQKILPRRILETWVLMPSFVFVLVLLPQYLMKFQLVPGLDPHAIYMMRGGGTLAANAILVVWARQSLVRTGT